MMNYKESIVPLLHKSIDGENYFDGTGFIINYENKKSILVTCWHNFDCLEKGTKSFFIYKSIEYEINRQSEKYFEGTGSYIEKGEFRKGIVDDYSYFILDFLIDNPLEIDLTSEICDKIKLITHDVNSGKQVEFECNNVYFDDKPQFTMNGLPFAFDALNLFLIECYEAKKGHSGGVLISLDNRKCLGFLHGETPITKHLWIIKAKTIIERFLELKGSK